MVKNLTRLLQGAQVQFLVGELRSHMLCSVAKKKKKKVTPVSALPENPQNPSSQLSLLGPSSIAPLFLMPSFFHSELYQACSHRPPSYCSIPHTA